MPRTAGHPQRGAYHVTFLYKFESLTGSRCGTFRAALQHRKNRLAGTYVWSNQRFTSALPPPPSLSPPPPCSRPSPSPPLAGSPFQSCPPPHPSLPTPPFPPPLPPTPAVPPPLVPICGTMPPLLCCYPVRGALLIRPVHRFSCHFCFPFTPFDTHTLLWREDLKLSWAGGEFCNKTRAGIFSVLGGPCAPVPGGGGHFLI